MSAATYSLEAWRRFRERKERQPEPAATAGPSLADIPPDAEMDEGITLGCWNGERFVSWEKWLATAPLAVEASPKKAPPLDASAYDADCGGTRVWLVKDGDRWLMFAGSRKAGSRRRDFASPFVEHAMRTAEAWYGPPASGWRPETRTAAAGKEVLDADPAK
jgi:hypothetical protein